MKRISGAAIVVGVLVALSVSNAAGRQAPPPATTQAQAQKMTFDGRTALWTVAIKPDKTADFERIMTRLRDGLIKSENQARRQQAAGWRVVKVDKALPDGNVVYVHVIDPVVPGADYSVMQTLYEAFPDERQALYDLYRGAFAQNLSLATGAVVLDMSRAPQAASASIP
jgi:hypothetical protein